MAPLARLGWNGRQKLGRHATRGGETGQSPVLTRNRRASTQDAEPGYLREEHNRFSIVVVYERDSGPRGSQSPPVRIHSGPVTERPTLKHPFIARISATFTVATLTLGGALAMGTAANAHEPGSACEPGEGVTVVVDFTDLGGQIEVGCATGDPKTGREALESAGFHPVDSQPGMICAIDEQPNPCPTEFTGSFWSYWNATTDGDWTSYMVGADSSDPVQGSLEGWRYCDGTAGPTLTPTEASKLTAAAASPSPIAEEVNPPTTTTESQDSSSTVLLWATVGFAAAVIVVIALLVVRSRRGNSAQAQGHSNSAKASAEGK